MAARRGKSQARRSGGSNGAIPGWAWLALGVALTVVVIVAAPKVLKSGDGDGFFRPKPNPDATPTAGSDDEAVVPEANARPADDADARADARPAQDKDYDFYTLLPGKEVELSDAELAATARAEAQREARREADARRQAEAQRGAATAPAGEATLPAPVEERQAATATPRAGTPSAVAETAATSSALAAGNDDVSARYLLQAGAFQASGQAEELKAKIALLGLGARVESAAIAGKTVYRVRMGPYGSASELADAKRKLAGGGLPAMAIQVK